MRDGYRCFLARISRSNSFLNMANGYAGTLIKEIECDGDLTSCARNFYALNSTELVKLRVFDS